MLGRAPRVAGFLAAMLLAAALFPWKFSDKMRDFEVYWQAAGRAARAEALYQPSDGHYQYKYFPAFAVLLAPLSALPLTTAKLLWLVLSVGLLVALIDRSRALLPAPRGPTWWIVGATLVVLGKFYGHELVLGQSNILLAVLIVLGGLGAWQRGRPGLAGVWLGLGVVVKPYALIFLPYLLARRAWRALVGLAAVTCAGLALPALIYGVDGTLELTRAWWSTVTSTTGATLASQDNVSIAGMYAKWFSEGWLAPAATVITIGVLAVAVPVTWAAGRLVRAPTYLDFGALLILIPLLSPQGWDYVLLLSTPAVMLLADRLVALPRAWTVVTALAMAGAGLSLYDVMGRSAYAWFMSLSLVTVCFLTMLAALARLRLGRLA